MEYVDPYPSSVPDITLVPADFQLDRTFFVCSVALECLCLLIVLFLVVLSFHFSCGNHRLLIDQQSKKTNKRDAENIICQVLEKTDYLQKLEASSSNSSTENNHPQGKSATDLDAELLAQQLRLYERRAVYFCTFIIPWVLCINFFSADIFLLIIAGVFIALVAGFNLLRMMPNWKVTLLIYFLPALAALGPYMSNTDTLYEWEPVVEALEI